jgi:restriction system protein
MLFGSRWQTAAWRALAVFAIVYVLPAALLAPPSRLVAFLQLLATVATFALVTAAVYMLLQSRSAGWQEEAEATEPDEPPPAPVVRAAHAAPEMEPAAPVASAPSLETLAQGSLERLCIALYQFNGLNSQTVTSGVQGHYRIRLVQRNAAKPLALLQCQAGTQPQGFSAYAALLRDMEEEGLEKAFFVAPAGFAPQVVSQAAERHVTLVDSRLLQAMLERVPEGTRAAIFAAAV